MSKSNSALGKGFGKHRSAAHAKGGVDDINDNTNMLVEEEPEPEVIKGKLTHFHSIYSLPIYSSNTSILFYYGMFMNRSRNYQSHGKNYEFIELQYQSIEILIY